MSTFRRGPDLPDGLYEDVVTERLARQLAALSGEARVELDRLAADDAVEALTRLVAQATGLTLASVGRGKEGLEAQVALARRLLEVLVQHDPRLFRTGEAVPTDQRLLSIARKNVVGELPTPPLRPATSLSRSDLFTNSERHSVVQELLSEIASADRIDLLCAFIKWSGFLKFREALAAHCRKGRELRVLTTTYLGATEARAIEELQRLGAQVRISYEETPTRLHAKAWMFHRHSGLSTAYIGSSNLSRAALTEGLEWNVRVASAELPRVIEKFEAVFRRYWEDPDAGFQPYVGAEEDRARLRGALRRARGAANDDGRFLRFLDVHPHDYQRRMLEDLALARSQGRVRNLVVAATGTGKTVVAALDYARERREGRVDTLLFVAHRDTILRQARETFRAVLKDGGFGELWVDGARPEHGRHLFASIQSLAAAGQRGQVVDPQAFDHVVIDEVHHAPAETYAQLLRRLEPKLLVGLTATPERMDDEPGGVLQLHEFFDHPWASELRLWDAIDRQILVPFNYFALDDGTDVRRAWKRGRYQVGELSNVYAADHAWVDRVARAIAHNVRSVPDMRAIAFCVDVAHAQLVARVLSAKLAVRCEALTGSTRGEERESLLRAFAGEAEDRPRVLCVVDLLNEGVDVPPVDTLLLLRPTESATVFIQQIGRGLRRAPDKDSLTVLDFVGQQHESFRFDLRYAALLGVTRPELQRALRDGAFPHLPSGCSFQLEERPRKQILAALKRVLGLDLRSLAERLGEADESLNLERWLLREQLELPDLYANKRSWTQVREHRGFAVPPIRSEAEATALRELQRLVHVDDPWRLDTLEALLTPAGPDLPSERERRLVRMLGVILFGFGSGGREGEVHASLQRMDRLRWELGELLGVLRQRARVLPRPPSTLLPDAVPLHLHARYLTEEIAAAFDLRTREGLLYRPQTGVIAAGDFDLLLVTLDKANKKATPHLQYRDYAISGTLFHWESQASTRRDDNKGLRHLSDAVRPLLFVREINKDARGLGVAYRYLGVVERVDDEGERPIRITWRLREGDMPAELLQHSRIAVA